MTGFGSSSSSSSSAAAGLEVQIRTVNGRFLDLRFHMPKEWSAIESELRQIVMEKVGRGTVDVSVSKRHQQESAVGPQQLHRHHAAHWVKALKSLAKELKISPDIRLAELWTLPGVLESADANTAPVKVESDELKRLLGLALVQLDESRRREGGRLVAELKTHLNELQNHVEKMQALRAKAVAGMTSRVQNKLKTLIADGLDPSRLAMEIALLGERMDVEEEIVRLQEHIRTCLALLGQEIAVGKKLDFYCQELLREVNTIGSKAQLVEMTQVVVEAKTTIDRFREQVQNIE